jgi:hypothetical protein
MWIPSLNAIGLFVIGIGILTTVFIKKRKTDTMEVTVLGAENSLHLSRTKLTLLLGSILVLAGSILSYFEYQKEIGIRNIAIIDEHLAIVQSNPGGVSLGLEVANMEMELNLSVLNRQIKSEIAQSEKSNDITAVIDLDSRDSSVLFKLFKIYQGSSSYNKADALISRYSEYFIRSAGSKENLENFMDSQRPIRIVPRSPRSN